MTCKLIILCNSHEKWKESLDRVIFAAKLELPKILIPRFPQNTLNVNNAWAENQNYYNLYVISLFEHKYLFYSSDINLRFQLIMPGGNWVIYGYSSPRTTPGTILCRYNTEGAFLKLLPVVGRLKTIQKVKLKTKQCIVCRLFLLFPFFNIHTVKSFEIFPGK